MGRWEVSLQQDCLNDAVLHKEAISLVPQPTKASRQSTGRMHGNVCGGVSCLCLASCYFSFVSLGRPPLLDSVYMG